MMFDTILCHRDFEIINEIWGHKFLVQQWQSDQQLKDLLFANKKVLLITDQCDVIPDIYNMSKFKLTGNISFHHFDELVEPSCGFFPNVNDLSLCQDFYRISGIYLVCDHVKGELPSFKNEVLITNNKYEPALSYKRAMFLDRDGIINIDTGYAHKVEELEFRKGIFKFLSDKKYKDISKFIVTNQAGIARGYFGVEEVSEFHQKILEEFLSRDISIKQIEISAYHFEKGIGEYRAHSLTRKPHPGMILKILQNHRVDLENSWMIGDKLSDHLEIQLLQFAHLKGKYDLIGAKAKVAQDFAQLKNIVKYS